VFLSQNGQRGSLLVCNWLHSVGQNHFYVMMLLYRGSVIFRSVSFCVLHSVGQNHFYVMLLLSQGCCFIQSLHFSYELQEDSVQNSNQSVQFLCIRPDGVVFCPDAHESATSIRTT
jgi:hypothetical protein